MSGCLHADLEPAWLDSTRCQDIQPVETLQKTKSSTDLATLVDILVSEPVFKGATRSWLIFISCLCRVLNGIENLSPLPVDIRTIRDVKTPRHNKQQHLLMYRRVTYGKRRNTDSNNADYVESLTRFNDHDCGKHVGLVLIQLMSLSEL